MRLTNRRVFLYIFLIAAIVFLMIPLLRGFQIVGGASYYHSRMAEYILEKGIPKTDPLAARPYLFQPYHIVLAGLILVFGIRLASFIIPLVCGLCSVAVFYKILRHFNFRPQKIFFVMLIFVLCPATIWCFSTSNYHCAALLFSILGFYLFLRAKMIPSVMLFGLAAVFSIFSLIAVLAVLLVYCAGKKKLMKWFYIALGVGVFVLVSKLPFVLHFGLPLPGEITVKGVLIDYMADIGGIFGYGIFNVLLALLGLYLIWKEGKRVLAYGLFIVLVIFSFYFNSMIAYLSFIFALLAGSGLYGITRMKWRLKLIKKLTVIVLIAGLVFSAVSYIGRISAMLPNESVIESLEWLKEHSKPNEVVFSHYSKGFWIEAIADRPVVADPLFQHTEDFLIRINNSKLIFSSRNLAKAMELLDLYNVVYIWIDSEMREGQVWSREQEGLLFLFRNKKTFKKIYDKGGIVIYKYKGGG